MLRRWMTGAGKMLFRHCSFFSDAIKCSISFYYCLYFISNMKKLTHLIVLSLVIIAIGCNSNTGKPATVDNNANKSFEDFEKTFLDAYWQHYPAASIFIGYGKYYDNLVIPDSASVKKDIDFSKYWLDSLAKIDENKLTDNNKISLKIIQHQLNRDSWYQSVFKEYEWNPSLYNLGAECDYIINQPYAPLNERLGILSKHIANADSFYKAALGILHDPTREHTELAIMQGRGSVAVFGKGLSDSVAASTLPATEKELLQQRIAATIQAINHYVTTLQAFVQHKTYKFRDFRIGTDLYKEKFKQDLATDFEPEEIYKKAMDDKRDIHGKMYVIANELWGKYYGSKAKPADTISTIQMVMDKVQLQHAAPKDFFDSLTSQVHQLKKFIIEKDLFDFDTANPPIIVRLMPEYARGFAAANAEFTPPYQKHGATYFNIDDLAQYPADKAESSLREYNNYASQLLSIHEAVPGHCLQGIYNSKKSPDVLRSVFQNGAMIEGWAVYTEDMMIENGWGNNEPEMQLCYYKLKLRELANVLIDYDIQCLNKSKDEIHDLLVNQCFQTASQAEEKYHRATVSQVQLCSYYTGATAIRSLRDDYKNKMQPHYSLKDFHEKFLSFGSSPVKYIRELMMK